MRQGRVRGVGGAGRGAGRGPSHRGRRALVQAANAQLEPLRLAPIPGEKETVESALSLDLENTKKGGLLQEVGLVNFGSVL